MSNIQGENAGNPSEGLSSGCRESPLQRFQCLATINVAGVEQKVLSW